MLLENGTYSGTVKDVAVYLRGDNNRLSAAFRVEIEGKDLKYNAWLELNDGTISTKTIDGLRKSFPKWDGTIETLDDISVVENVAVSCVIENEQDREDPAKWWTRIKWMNPPGGGGAELPVKASKATLAAKYGAKFRALAGGVPAKQMTLPPPPFAPVGPPVPPVAESTLEACWASVEKESASREVAEARWFALLAKVGKDQAIMTGADWGRVMVEIKGDQIPY